MPYKKHRLQGKCHRRKQQRHESLHRQHVHYTFKERFRNHKKSIANPLYATNTELSKYVWSLKEKNKEYNIKWDIVKQVPSYKSGGKQCSLCSNEKLYIFKAEKGPILNKRSEIFSRCIHQRRFLAENLTARILPAHARNLRDVSKQ